MLKVKQLSLGFSLLAIFSIFGYAQKAPKVDFAKKIQEATPQALPQEPVAKRAKSDASDNNLKGKVKSIIEFTQESGKRKRELSSEEFYNENGNLVKAVSYEEGYPMSVAVYGYIDGNRVLNTGYINYTAKERQPSPRTLITVDAEDNALNRDAPKDTRYKIRFEYKYNEQNQLVEKWEYQNNGEVWTHVVYKYKENQREELNIGRDGTPWSQTIEILDANGNVIERHLMDEEGKIGDKEINVHEFDSQGNWIVQRTYDEKTIKGKPFRKLLWTTYRTIVYYP